MRPNDGWDDGPRYKLDVGANTLILRGLGSVVADVIHPGGQSWCGYSRYLRLFTPRTPSGTTCVSNTRAFVLTLDDVMMTPHNSSNCIWY